MKFNKVYTPALANRFTKAFHKMSSAIKKNLNTMLAPRVLGFAGVDVTSMSSGSVVVDFVVVYHTEYSNATGELQQTINTLTSSGQIADADTQAPEPQTKGLSYIHTLTVRNFSVTFINVIFAISLVITYSKLIFTTTIAIETNPCEMGTAYCVEHAVCVPDQTEPLQYRCDCSGSNEWQDGDCITGLLIC